MSTSREGDKDTKSLIPTQALESSPEDKSIGNLGSYKSNYYKELFNNPLEDSPPSKLVKTDKVHYGEHAEREQDEIQTMHEAPKFHHLQNEGLSASKYHEKENS